MRLPDKGSINHSYKCSACGELYGIYDVHDCAIKRAVLVALSCFNKQVSLDDINWLGSIGVKW